MRVAICGVRGSTPATGAAFARYGGNTSCVAIASRDDVPDLILDAGTGIRSVTRLLAGRPFCGTILLSHLHWDHVEGLPFFSAADADGADTRILLPAQGEDPKRLFERMMSPPFFPVGPDGLNGVWKFEGLEEGEHELEGLRVSAREVPHKGGRAFGYRITGEGSVAYVPDHSPIAGGPGVSGLGEYHDPIMDLARGADVLFHDAQHTAAEFEAVKGFGHSSIEYAVGMARAAEVKKLVLFHHSPTRDDDAIDAIVRELATSDLDVEAAREGMTLDL